MIYHILCLFYVILNVIIGTIYKSVNADVFFINLVSSLIIFLSFFIKDYLSSKYSGSESNKFNDSKDKTTLTKSKIDKVIDNLTTKEAFIIGASGCFSFVLSLLSLKNLPLSIFIPLSNSWIFFSLFFEKLLLNIDVSIENIFVFILLFIGIITVTYTQSSKSSDTKYMYIGILLISAIIRAFHITYVKQQSENYDEDELLTMDYFVNTILGLLLFIGYVVYQKKYNLPDKKSILIILGVILLLDNSKNYLKFLSIKHLSENEYILLLNTSLLFSLVLGYYLYNEKITTRKVAGNIIILLSMVSYLYINQNK